MIEISDNLPVVVVGAGPVGLAAAAHLLERDLEPLVLEADGEQDVAEAIAYGLPNVLAQRDRYAGRRVLVVGSGHSAMNALQDLVTLKQEYPATEITWAVRRRTTDDLYGGGTGDGLPERAELGATVERLVGHGAIPLVTGVEIDALERNG